jgi:hypothetical protein
MSNALLPDGFEFLEPFAAAWGDLTSQDQRYRARQSLGMDELQAFHEALATRLEQVFSHLDKFPMDALPEQEARLYRIALGLTEAAQAVELFGQPRVPYAPYPHHPVQEWVGYDPH